MSIDLELSEQLCYNTENIERAEIMFQCYSFVSDAYFSYKRILCSFSSVASYNQIHVSI